MKLSECSCDLPEGCTAINIATWNLEIKRLKVKILYIAKTHQANEKAEPFEYNDHAIYTLPEMAIHTDYQYQDVFNRIILEQVSDKTNNMDSD